MTYIYASPALTFPVIALHRVKNTNQSVSHNSLVTFPTTPTFPAATANGNSGVTFTGDTTVNIVVSGLYEFISTVRQSTSSASPGNFFFQLRINSVGLLDARATIGNLNDFPAQPSLDLYLELVAGDTIEVMMILSSDAVVAGGGGSTWLQVIRHR